MKYLKILLLVIALLNSACKKEQNPELGPFKPVSADLSSIIILGEGPFFAYNIETKQVEAQYDIRGFADVSGYALGHLIIGLPRSDFRYNVNIKTGKVTRGNFMGMYPLPTANDSVLELTSRDRHSTYRYNVVTNKIVNTFQHPIPRHYGSYSIVKSDTTYWFPDTYLTNSYSKYLINSYGDTLYIGIDNGNEIVM